MLEIIKIDGSGFLPLKDYQTWRIAQMSYDVELNSIEGFKFLGRHFETDEVFMVLEGHAVLVTAGELDHINQFLYQKLLPGFLYTVKKNHWHAAILNQEARLLIIENQDTGADNSEQYAVTAQEKSEIIKCYNNII